MNISFHTGKSAMIAQGQAIDIYGNNIANVNTNGYQTLRPSFADCLYVKERSPEPDWQTGHGTYIQKTDLMFAESHFVETGRPQDLAINGEGWFAVQDRYGDVNYTRDGCFGMTQDPDSGDWYLISSSGEYVLDYDQERIVIPFEEVSKESVRAGINWNDISARIGTFTMDNVDAQRIRYDYTPTTDNEITAVSGAAANVENQTLTANGYFAVREKSGATHYTTDGRFAMIESGGKWYLGSGKSEFILDTENNPIELSFVDAEHIGDFNSVDWNAAAERVGVFTLANPENLHTDDTTRYDGNATANANIGKTVNTDSYNNVTLNNADGFFAVEGENGIRYTRNTKFDVAQGDDGAWYLATNQGEFVLDANNQQIQVAGADEYTNVPDWAEVKREVGVFRFPNPFGLEAGANNRYVQTQRSGEAVACREPDGDGGWIYTMEKLEGALITSNVDLTDMMVKLIEAQRSYQISSRVVTTSDEIARIANNLR